MLRVRFPGLLVGAEGQPLPVFGMGHSLGAKLQMLTACADGQAAQRRAGFYLMSFNNFSAGDNVRLLEQYARELLQRRDLGTGTAAAEALLRAMPMVARAAEGIAAQAGVEFSPSKQETLARVGRLQCSAATRVRLLSFETDTLDQSADLEPLLQERTTQGIPLELTDRKSVV